MVGFSHLRDPQDPEPEAEPVEDFWVEEATDGTGTSHDTTTDTDSWLDKNRVLVILLAILGVLLITMFALLGVYVQRKRKNSKQTGPPPPQQ